MRARGDPAMIGRMPEHLDVAPADAQPLPPAPALTISPASAQTPTPAVIPGRTLGIVAFALSFLALVNVVALVLGIVALLQSKRVGHRNGFAIAAIVIASAGVLIGLLVLSLTVPTLVDAAQTCARLGDGVHEVGTSTYTCTPTSFHVVRRFG